MKINRKYKKYHPRSPDELCSVCGKQANYKFYGVVTCDSCRTFFRRGVIKDLKDKCINKDGNCIITPKTVKKCSSCRYKKCLKVGMRIDYVTHPGNVSKSTSVVPLNNNKPLPDLVLAVPRPDIDMIDTHIQGLTVDEKSKLFEMMKMIESTILRADDLKIFIGDRRTNINTSLTLFITRIVKGFTRLKGAEHLDCDDKRILLKNSVGKINYMKSVPQFDFESGSWNVYQDPIAKKGWTSSITTETMAIVCPTVVHEFYELVKSMDPTVRKDFIFATILSAICFFDPSHVNLRNPEAVVKEQNVYLSILQKLIDSRKIVFNKSIYKPCLDVNCCSDPKLTCKKFLVENFEKNIFTRLQKIQDAFESTILFVDPRKQIDFISNVLKS